MIDGRPAWTWKFGQSSGVRGQPDETKARFEKKMTEIGFKSVESPDQKLPMAFRREIEGCEEQVRMGIPGLFPFAQSPTVGVELEWSVRSAAKQATPTLSEVFEAMPTLQPPKRGGQLIPEAALAIFLPERVTSVALNGPGTTWYSLDLDLPKSAEGGRPEWFARLEETLKKEEFPPTGVPLGRNEEAPILDLTKRKARSTANCHIRVFERAEVFHVAMFVQTGEEH
jgi:hypothetical protein